MKYSIVLLSAATLASAVKPVILNSNYDVVEGEPFVLTFTGCEAGCTITIEAGTDEESFKPVDTLTTDATGGEVTLTVSDVPSGSYAFRITDNETDEYNFGGTFEYEGTGEAPTTVTTADVTSTTEEPEETSTTEAEETTTTEEETSTTTEEETSTTTEEETTSTPETTSFTTTTSDAESTTTEASTTTEEGKN
jgi:hypothetical protein